MGRGLAAAAAVLTTMAAGAEPATAAARSCATAGRTVAANEQARVFSIVVRGAPAYYACRYAAPRRRLLGFTQDDGGVVRVLLAGSKALVVSDEHVRAYGDEIARVRVHDLVRRRVERRWDFYRRASAKPARVAVHGATLRPDGSAAFVAGPLGGEAYELHRADATGVARVDAGPDIDPGSLAVGARWLYWTRGGAPASAPFRARRVKRGADRSPRKRCSRARSRTLALNGRIRVLTVPERDDPDSETVSACLLRTGRLTRLGTSDLFDPAPRLAAVAGNHLLTSTRYYGRGSGDLSLDVRTWAVPGGRGTGWSFWQASPAPTAPSIAIRGHALRPTGAAAFLVGPVTDVTSNPYAQRFEVHAATAGGEPRVLDAAPDVAPRSFAAGERRIYWKRGREIRMAAWP